MARLTKEQKAQKLIQDSLIKRDKALLKKREQLAKEEQELQAEQRKLVMKTVTHFSLSTAELDAFVSALDGWPGKHDLAVAILNAAKSNGTANMDQLNTKLVRLGFE